MLNLDIKNFSENLDSPRCRWGLASGQPQCKRPAVMVWVDKEGNSPVGRFCDESYVICVYHSEYFATGPSSKLVPLADRC